MAWVNAIIQGLLTGGLYALFACGLSLLFGVMKVVNLAHGDLATVAGYIGVGIIAVTHVPVLWSIPIVVVLMAVLGYVLQRSLLQAAISRGELTTLIVTFGLSIIIENGLQQFFTANSRGLGVGDSFVTASFSIGSQITIAWLDLGIFVLAVVVLLVEQDVSQTLRVATHLQCLLEGHTTLEGTPAEVNREQVEAAYFGVAEGSNNGLG